MKISIKRRSGITLVDLLALIVSLPACYLVFVMGAFASDSGTGAATALSFIIIGFAGLYALATIVFVVLSQIRDSFKLSAIPLILPILFYLWILFY